MFKLTIAVAVLLCVTGLNGYVVTRNAPKHHLKVRDVSNKDYETYPIPPVIIPLPIIPEIPEGANDVPEIEPPYIPTDPINPDDPDGDVIYVPGVDQSGEAGNEDAVVVYPNPDDDYETYPIPPVIIPLPIIPEIPEGANDDPEIAPPYIPTDPIDPDDPDGDVEYLPGVEESEETEYEDDVVVYPNPDDVDVDVLPYPVDPDDYYPTKRRQRRSDSEIEPPYIPTDPIDPENPDGDVIYVPGVDQSGEAGNEDGVVVYPNPDDDYETYPIPPVIIPLPIIPEIPEGANDDPEIAPPYIPTDPINPDDPDGDVIYVPGVDQSGEIGNEDGVVVYPNPEDVDGGVLPYPVDPDDYYPTKRRQRRSDSEIEPPYIPTDPIDPENPDGDVIYVPGVDQSGEAGNEDAVVVYPNPDDEYETYPIPPVIIPLPIIPEIPEGANDDPEIAPPYIPTDPIDPDDPDGDVEYLPGVEESEETEYEDDVVVYPNPDDVDVDVLPYPVDPDDYYPTKRRQRRSDSEIEPPYIPTDPIDPENPDGDVIYVPGVDQSGESNEDGVVVYPNPDDDYETYPIPPVIIPLPIIPEIPEGANDDPEIAPPYIPTDPIDPDDPDGDVEYLPGVEESEETEYEDDVVVYPNPGDVDGGVLPFPVDPDDYYPTKRRQRRSDSEIEPPYIPTDPIDPENPDGDVIYVPGVDQSGESKEDGVVVYPNPDDDYETYPIPPVIIPLPIIPEIPEIPE